MGQAALKSEKMFGFGENWADYAQHIDERHIIKAQTGLAELLNGISLEGKTFLDIGCGSGLHSLAALKAGVTDLTALDIDENSVSTARKVIGKNWGAENYKIKQASILDDETLKGEIFDVVYSWGVLHHTGNMNKAIDNAANKVKDDGYFIIALYKETPFCGFWKAEKKLYTNLPKILRYPLDWLYGLAQIGGLLIKGRNPIKYISTYKEKRGMKWMYDIRDWLGGYPYESISPADIEKHMKAKGFKLEHSLNDGPMVAKGILGSGCGEYVFKKTEAA